MSSSKGFRNNQIKTRNKIEQDEHCDNADARRVTQVDADGEYAGTAENPINVTGNLDIGLGATNVQIFNISVPNANVEYFFPIPNNTKKFEIKIRQGSGIINYAFTPGDSSVNYITIKQGNKEVIEDINFSGKVLYFQTNKDNKVVEIKAWI